MQQVAQCYMNTANVCKKIKMNQIDPRISEAIAKTRFMLSLPSVAKTMDNDGREVDTTRYETKLSNPNEKNMKYFQINKLSQLSN